MAGARMKLPRDFVDLLRAFAAREVRFLVVGAYALAGVKVDVLGREDFLVNKRATGRIKDRADAQRLDRQQPRRRR